MNSSDLRAVLDTSVVMRLLTGQPELARIAREYLGRSGGIRSEGAGSQSGGSRDLLCLPAPRWHAQGGSAPWIAGPAVAADVHGPPHADRTAGGRGSGHR